MDELREEMTQLILIQCRSHLKNQSVQNNMYDWNHCIAGTPVEKNPKLKHYVRKGYLGLVIKTTRLQNKPCAERSSVQPLGYSATVQLLTLSTVEEDCTRIVFPLRFHRLIAKNVTAHLNH